MQNRMLFLMADGFEEMEFVVPFDIWIRGGVKVALAGILDEPIVESSHGMALRVDARLSEIDPKDYVGIFLPGGGRGTENLRASDDVLSLVRDFHSEGKWVTAICAAPTVLAAAGILHDKRVTSYPSTESAIRPYCNVYSEDRVVVDQNVVTSRAAGTAEEFAFAMLSLLQGKNAAEEVRRAIVSR